MGFRVVVYSFRKRINSTKRVTKALALENTEMDCQLKLEGCGINNPIMVINYGLEKSPTNFNYAYIPVFKRYYFVRDWYFRDGLWEGYLVEDYLATWREFILNYNAYVLRASSQYNSNISDPLCAATANITITSREIPNPVNLAGGGELPVGEGVYVVGINGKNNVPYASSGTVTYYALEPISMQTLGNFLMQNIEYLNIDWNADAKKFLTPELLKTLFNPLQYIASVMWFPEVAADIGTPVNTIPFGFWDCEIIGRRLSPREMIQTWVRKIPIPKHPQASAYGKWLNLSPYAVYQLHVSPYGLVDVPADEILDSTELSIEMVTDYGTGDGRIMVASNKRFISIFNFQYGTSVELSQLTQNGIGMYTSGMQYLLQRDRNGLRATQAIEDFALFDVVGAQIGAVETNLNFIGDIVNCMSPTVQSTGSNGSRAWYYTGEIFWRLSGKFINVTDPGADVNGRPLCAYRRLGDLSGYVICEGASLEFEGNSLEQDAVNAYLNRGFYIE